MKIAIMQPYFLPYIGYWQLINAVDRFIVYDNIKYTKKGWINRNRYLQNGKDMEFTIPLKKDSDFLNVVERNIADDFNRVKLLNKISASYRKAPYYQEIFKIFGKIIGNDDVNLFKFIYYSIMEIRNYLEISSEIVISSDININHSLKGQDKVIALCKANSASIYINASDGQKIYSRKAFSENGIDIKFIQSDYIEYKQFNHDFVPWLSILDIMMFNNKDTIKEMLKKYVLV
jgi:hypothetical protein